MSRSIRKGFLAIALTCLAAVIIFAIVAPTLLRRRLAESEWSAPDDLREVDAAIGTYIKEHGTAPLTLTALRGQIPPALSCDDLECKYRNYRLRYTVWSAKPESLRYSLSARALSRNGTSFYLDETGVMRYTTEDRAATQLDPALARQPVVPK